MERSRNNRKLLTLNTHSWMEPENRKKLRILANAIAREEIDIAAFQEVNQSIGEQEAMSARLLSSGFCPGEKPIDIKTGVKSDNYGFLLARELASLGKRYYWTWVPSHIGYDRFDEGIALFSRHPILEIKSGYVSDTKDFKNPRARMAVGIRVGNEAERDNGRGTWYYSVHLSRWTDGAERFARQWEALERMTGQEHGLVWIMGDFNSPAQDVGEGYSFVQRENRWKDCFTLAEECCERTWEARTGSRQKGRTGAGKTQEAARQGLRGKGTVRAVIDGWRDTGREGIRIDYIMVNQDLPALEYKTVFDGENDPVVSDHYGVMVTVREG